MPSSPEKSTALLDSVDIRLPLGIVKFKLALTHSLFQSHSLVVTYGIETENVIIFPQNTILSDHFLIKIEFTIIDYMVSGQKLYYSLYSIVGIR